jgi:hypothetical protein
VPPGDAAARQVAWERLWRRLLLTTPDGRLDQEADQDRAHRVDPTAIANDRDHDLADPHDPASG